MNFNVIAGLPRSGSTLICNILNQRSDTYASSTSALPNVLGGVSQVLSNSPEETSRLTNIPGTAEHHVKIGRAIAKVWHDTDAENVFDKSRLWNSAALLLRSIEPGAGMIICVRDPREVLASVERRNAETGMYGAGRDLYETCSQHISETGLIGGPIKGVEDLLRRKLPNVYFVEYDTLCAAPEKVMRNIEKTCGLVEFDYDFDDVVSTATDLDPLYRNKFPHEGSGKVESRNSDWREVISEDIARGTLERWPFYCTTFGYQ